MFKAPRVTPVTPNYWVNMQAEFKETKNFGIGLLSLKSSLLELISLETIFACNSLVPGSGILKQHSNHCLYNQTGVNSLSRSPISGDAANIHAFSIHNIHFSFPASFGIGKPLEFSIKAVIFSKMKCVCLCY